MRGRGGADPPSASIVEQDCPHEETTLALVFQSYDAPRISVCPVNKIE
jgi:hypothetical protein